MPLILNQSLMHLLTSIALLMVMGFYIERFFSILQTMAVYFLAGMGGVVMSCLFTSKKGIFPLTVFIGFIGAFAGYSLFYSKSKKLLSVGEKYGAYVLLVLVGAYFIMSSSTYTLDIYSAFGSFLVGALIICSSQATTEDRLKVYSQFLSRVTEYEKQTRLFARLLLVAYFGVSLTMLFYYGPPEAA
jgi:membrane associated rhomboid family serine protease